MVSIITVVTAFLFIVEAYARKLVATDDAAAQSFVNKWVDEFTDKLVDRAFKQGFLFRGATGGGAGGGEGGIQSERTDDKRNGAHGKVANSSEWKSNMQHVRWLTLLSPQIQSRAKFVNMPLPILNVDNLLSDENVSFCRDCILKHQDQLHSTARRLPQLDQLEDGEFGRNPHLDDSLTNGAQEREDADLRSIIQGSNVEIPEEYISSLLLSFVYVLTKAASKSISQESMAKGLMVLEHMKTRKIWESKDLQKYYASLGCNQSFEITGRRFEMPEKLREFLVNQIVPQIFSQEVQWKVREATVMIYQAGESQVPHIDMYDVTLLFYLSDDVECDGGHTAFPFLNCRVSPHRGKTLIMMGKSHDWSLHYGGKVSRGQKVIAQFLINVDESSAAKVQVQTPYRRWQEEHVELCKKAVSDDVELTLASMRLDDEDFAIQADGCAALRSLALRNQENKIDILKFHGIETILAAMHDHRSDSFVQAAGCRALQSLASENISMKIVKLGGIAAIKAAMQAHSCDYDVQRDGAEALRSLEGFLR